MSSVQVIKPQIKRHYLSLINHHLFLLHDVFVLIFFVKLISTFTHLLPLAQIIYRSKSLTRMQLCLTDNALYILSRLRQQKHYMVRIRSLLQSIVITSIYKYRGYSQTYRIYQHLGTVETDTAQDFNGLCQKSNMEDRFRELYVSKVSGTLCHGARTCHTSRMKRHACVIIRCAVLTQLNINMKVRHKVKHTDLE